MLLSTLSWRTEHCPWKLENEASRTEKNCSDARIVGYDRQGRWACPLHINPPFPWLMQAAMEFVNSPCNVIIMGFMALIATFAKVYRDNLANLIPSNWHAELWHTLPLRIRSRGHRRTCR